MTNYCFFKLDLMITNIVLFLMFLILVSYQKGYLNAPKYFVVFILLFFFYIGFITLLLHAIICNYYYLIHLFFFTLFAIAIFIILWTPNVNEQIEYTETNEEYEEQEEDN